MKNVAPNPFKTIIIMVLKPFLSRSTVLIALILLCLVQNSVAQFQGSRTEVKDSWEFGFSGGVSQFQNSINPNSDAPFKKFNYWNADFNPAITLSVIKNFSPKFSAEFEYLTTKLSGSWNKNSPYGIPQLALDQGLEYPKPFKTGINQFVLMFVPNLNQIIAPNKASKKWYVFVKAGIGAAFLKEYAALYPYDASRFNFKYSLAYGGGLSYKINQKIKLKLGTTWYRVESDRLDGINTLKPNGDVSLNGGYYFNVKERYVYSYFGMTCGLGQSRSKANLIRLRNNQFLWFKRSAHKYKR
jgi:hypothetical protein